MGSAVNREIAQEIIKNNGRFQTDPQVTHVIRYTKDHSGEWAWVVVYSDIDAARCFDPELGLIDPQIIWEAGCSICEEPTTFKPSHQGSPNCESGSLASGGKYSHCTCDTCF